MAMTQIGGSYQDALEDKDETIGVLRNMIAKLELEAVAHMDQIDDLYCRIQDLEGDLKHSQAHGRDLAAQRSQAQVMSGLCKLKLKKIEHILRDDVI
jgi:prefoldin subunit 5